jgi:hypothetical protein
MQTVDLYDVMRTTGAARQFTDDPLPDEVLERPASMLTSDYSSAISQTRWGVASSVDGGSHETLGFVTCTLGYATASAVGLNLEGQLAALSAAGVDPRRVFTDKLSDSAERVRAGLHAMLSYARSGDTVIVVAVDRLGRSAAEVTRTIADLTGRGIRLQTLKEGLDTGTSTGRVVARIITTLAQLDLEHEHQTS